MIVRAVVDEFRVAWFTWLMVLMIHCIYTRHGGAEYRWYPFFFDLGGRFHDFVRKKKIAIAGRRSSTLVDHRLYFGNLESAQRDIMDTLAHVPLFDTI